MNGHSAHSARHAGLHALTATLCALLLLVALCVMALHHAPWWTLLGVQGALLAATARAGMWLERWRVAREEFSLTSACGGGAPPAAPTDAREGTGHQTTVLRGAVDPGNIFWIERGPQEKEEDR